MKNKYLILLLLILPLVSCEKEESTAILQNDCIKRSIGPNLVGQVIEFTYAMALPQSAGKLETATVEASLAGAPGTFLDNKSYYTNSGGVDIGVEVGSPSVTDGTLTRVTFTRDTCASTLRYYYMVPEEARGKKVSFTFTAEATNGETVTYKMGPYDISSMDIKLDLIASDDNKCYISISDMAVYDSTEAAAIPGKIDLVYLYRNITGITFAHSLVSPASNPEYLMGITMPAGVNNRTPFIKVWALRDRQLARLQYGIYVDDLDFQTIDFTGATDFGINMKTESGAWVETADKKYRAYVYVNNVNNTTRTMTFSIKRYAL